MSVLGLAGLATSVSAWRHRAAFVHALGIAMITGAGVLAAREVLPKVGYAFPTPTHPASWSWGGRAGRRPRGGGGGAPPRGAGAAPPPGGASGQRPRLVQIATTPQPPPPPAPMNCAGTCAAPL